jgi:hypothetical protein
LDPEARYALTDLDARETQTLSGRELAESGLPIAIRTQPGAVVITYTKTK